MVVDTQTENSCGLNRNTIGSCDLVFKESRRGFFQNLAIFHPSTMASKQANRQAITLKGSTTLVTEFFKYAVNTYVRPPSSRLTTYE